MQSTGQTSIHASQPVQLSARMTASSLGSFFRALPAPLAMVIPRSEAAAFCHLPAAVKPRTMSYTILSEKLARGNGRDASKELRLAARRWRRIYRRGRPQKQELDLRIHLAIARLGGCLVSVRVFFGLVGLNGKE